MKILDQVSQKPEHEATTPKRGSHKKCAEAISAQTVRGDSAENVQAEIATEVALVAAGLEPQIS